MRKLITSLFVATIAISIAAQSHAQTTKAFWDVDSLNDSYFPILFLTQSKVLEGYQDGSFRPYSYVNRAEFIKILVASYYESDEINPCLDESKISPFPDVSKSEWYAKYICVAKRDGLIEGYPDGTFKPGNTISLVEAAKIFATFDETVSLAKSDPWYKSYVMWLEENKAIPQQICTFGSEINRGEVADIMFRLWIKSVEKKDPQEYWDFWTRNDTPGLTYQFNTTKSNSYENMEYLSYRGVCPDIRDEPDPNYHSKLIEEKLKNPDKVFTLYLAGTMRGEMMQELPTSIAKFRNLSSLNLSNNNLKSLPPEIGQLTSLTDITIHSNQLSSLPPEFYKLTKLKYIALHNNKLTSISDEIRKFSQLETLIISDNLLTKEQIAHIQSLLPNTKIFSMNVAEQIEMYNKKNSSKSSAISQ